MDRRARFRARYGLPLIGAWLSLCVPDSGVGQEALRRTRSVTSVRVEVTWVDSQAELDARRREYGAARPQTSVIRSTLEAFSVLGTRDGDLVCLIFSKTPERFDDRINTSLGHELLHCLGFSHGGG